MFFDITSLVYDKLITAVFRHEDFLNLGSHTRKKHMSLTKSRTMLDLPAKLFALYAVDCMHRLIYDFKGPRR